MENGIEKNDVRVGGSAHAYSSEIKGLMPNLGNFTEYSIPN